MPDADTDEGLWYQWTPSNAGSVAYADIATAVESFESIDTAAGEEATAWLRSHALANHPSTITYLYAVEDRIEGYFAIASSSVTLSQSHRSRLGPLQRDYQIHPTQGASLITWLARHKDSDQATAGVLLRYAIFIALKVATLQGTVVIVVEAYDERLATHWTKRYGFRRAGSTETGKARLWLPLHPL